MPACLVDSFQSYRDLFRPQEGALSDPWFTQLRTLSSSRNVPLLEKEAGPSTGKGDALSLIHSHWPFFSSLSFHHPSYAKKKKKEHFLLKKLFVFDIQLLRTALCRWWWDFKFASFPANTGGGTWKQSTPSSQLSKAAWLWGLAGELFARFC